MTIHCRKIFQGSYGYIAEILFEKIYKMKVNLEKKNYSKDKYNFKK